MKIIENRHDFVIEEVEASDAGLRLVTCQRCGFRFDAKHDDDVDGGPWKQWTCPNCEGKCPDCNGSGLVLVHSLDYWYPETDACLTCNSPEATNEPN